MPQHSVPTTIDTTDVSNSFALLSTRQWTRTMLVLLFVVLGSGTFAQCDNPFFRYIGTTLNSVSLVDSNTILAAGFNGYVIKSVDGGRRWRNIPTFSSNSITGLTIVAGSTGYAFGVYQTILKTEDMGESWFPLKSSVPENSFYYSATLNDICFIDKDRGFIAGDYGLLLSTTDGGRSWKDTSLTLSDRLTSIAFLNDSTVFIYCSNNSLYKTTNTGKTWQNIPLGPNTYNNQFRKIKFSNSTNGFILGPQGNCLKTTDGGISWTTVTLPSGPNYNDFCFLNPTKGFIVGDGGVLLVTSDGGTTWNLSLNIGPSLICIGKDPGGKRLMIAGGGSAYGLQGSNGRTLLSSTDGGTTFTAQSNIPNIKYNDVFFLNDSTGYVAGEYGYVFKTSDYGESWRALQNIPTVLGGNSARKIFFIDSLHGYAGTDNIYKTSDGGLSWISTATPGLGPQYFPIQLYFFDVLTGLVMDAGSIYKTVNGGASWQLVVTPPQVNFFRDFTTTPNGTVFAVGYNGEAIVSTDKGSTWAAANLTTSKYLSTVYFYDNNTGFIGTGDTSLFKTTDGGNTWVQINTGIPNLQTTSFHFSDPLTGYMVCNNNGGVSWIYKTSDGGQSWRYERSETGNLSHLVGFSTLYISSDYGLIMRTDKATIPVLPGYIYGRDSACVNSSFQYTTGTMTGVNYNWSLSGGGVSNFTLNKDSILWNTAGTYNLSLSVSNACGTSGSRTLDVTAVLFKPVINIMDSVLAVTEGQSYQWLKDGAYIGAAQGGNARTLVPALSGSYSVIVQSKYGCSETTPAISFTVDRKRLLCPGDSTLLYSSKFGNTYQWQRDTGSGFVNITDDTSYSGTNSSPLKIKNIPSSWYGYKYKCITNYGSGDTFTLQFVNSWTGNASNSWEDPANWSCGHLPDANTDVVVNSGTVIIHSDVTIRTLQLNPAAQLTVQSGYHLTIGH